MLQDINLYLLLPKKTGMYFTKKVVLTVYGIFLLVYILLYFVLLLQQKHLQLRYEALNKEVTTLEAQFKKMTANYPISNYDDLKGMIEKTRLDYQNKLNTVDLLSPNANFSAYMIALANAAVPGVWLKEINFNRTGIKIGLRGFSLEHALLEQFLTQLSQQHAFAGMNFELQELTENTKPATFYITSSV